MELSSSSRWSSIVTGHDSAVGRLWRINDIDWCGSWNVVIRIVVIVVGGLLWGCGGWDEIVKIEQRGMIGRVLRLL